MKKIGDALAQVFILGVISTPLLTAEAAAQEKSVEAKGTNFCANIADAAADARYALQKAELANMEKEIEGRLKILEAKRAEYEEWLRRRNEVLKKADETVVAIYSRMRPDAAALQLINMEEEIAAAVIARLSPRIASAVLNEMEPARAAQLASIITDAPKRVASNGGKE
ncbi:MotE family protein [Microvirga makkahensis]|uniref:MotE family protein n=1 Tax=Microvirga makkahensis TaxID=1128670 RepID=UPI00197BBE4C|nr:MotE family protein [Microvirga makkahensis]